MCRVIWIVSILPFKRHYKWYVIVTNVKFTLRVVISQQWLILMIYVLLSSFDYIQNYYSIKSRSSNWLELLDLTKDLYTLLIWPNCFLFSCYELKLTDIMFVIVKAKVNAIVIGILAGILVLVLLCAAWAGSYDLRKRYCRWKRHSDPVHSRKRGCWERLFG